MKGDEPTGAPCRIPSCGGIIMRHLGWHYDPNPRIGGPPQSPNKVTFHCGTCGVSYAFVELP